MNSWLRLTSFQNPGGKQLSESKDIEIIDFSLPENLFSVELAWFLFAIASKAPLNLVSLLEALTNQEAEFSQRVLSLAQACWKPLSYLMINCHLTFSLKENLCLLFQDYQSPCESFPLAVLCLLSDSLLCHCSHKLRYPHLRCGSLRPLH